MQTIDLRRAAATLAFCAGLAVACLPLTSAAAGDMSVVVNGARIAADVAPVEQDGRVLVPARAVFNALGAFVDYDAATKTIIAARPETTVVLHAFSQRATINGRSVWLDVPTQIMTGRTLVPLRFVSESLGAMVDYHGDIGVIAINLAGARQYVAHQNANAGPLAIDSLRVDTHDKAMLAAGDVIAVSVLGTPGAAATFDVAGIATGLALHEISPGTYTGFYVVPAGRNVNNIRVYAHLREGEFVIDRESDVALTIVGMQPTIRDAQPAPGVRTYVMQPSISGRIDDNGGPAVDPQSIRLYVDNSDVTYYAGVSADRFYFTPFYPLSPGWHRIAVYGQDLTGVDFSDEWSFYEIPAYPGGFEYGSLYPWQNLPIYNNCFNFGGFGYNGYPVVSLSTSAYGIVGPGGAIPIIMIARSGGVAIANIENAPGSVSLAPVFGAPGYYRGTYTVPFGLNINRAILVAQFYPPYGGLPVTVLQPTGIQIVSSVLRSKQILVHAPAVPPWIARVLPTPAPGHTGNWPPVRVVHAAPTLAPLPVWHPNARGNNATPLPEPFAPVTSAPRTPKPPTPEPNNGGAQPTPRPPATPAPTPRPTPRPKPHATQKPHPTPTPTQQSDSNH